MKIIIEQLKKILEVKKLNFEYKRNDKADNVEDMSVSQIENLISALENGISVEEIKKLIKK